MLKQSPADRNVYVVDTNGADATLYRKTKLVRLADPLPCCIWQPDGVCGKPATIAYAWEATPGPEWPVEGLWTLQPVCVECAAAALKRYSAEDTTP
jgi:hypothetical protein